MKDYSFIRLKNNFKDAKEIGNLYNDDNIPDYGFIRLFTDKAYCQITNVDGGISFDGNYKAELVNCDDEVVKNITTNVFIEEFIGQLGTTQLKFEIVNIGEDFYLETLYLKLSSTISDVVFYSNPFNVSNYQASEFVFYKYKSYGNQDGISYANANAWQSISLRTQRDIPLNETEVTSYFQVTLNQEVKARSLNKRYRQYVIRNIDDFGYLRLNNVLLGSDLVYGNDIRFTTEGVAESNDYIGYTNTFESSFVVAQNLNDVSPYEYQVFTGFNLVSFSPIGSFTLSNITSSTSVMTFNLPITLNTGFIKLYSENGTLISTYTESDITTDENELNIALLTSQIVANGNYYVNVSSGLISSNELGLVYEGITDSTTWAFTVANADFLSTDFNNSDFFTA